MFGIRYEKVQKYVCHVYAMTVCGVLRAFPVKDIISALGPVLSGNNSAAREVAMALMVDMTRWIGKSYR